ncbi:MAG: beta strand repeat-containing protein [Gemmatimonadales bacterium]
MTRPLLRPRNSWPIALILGVLVGSCDDDVGGPPVPQFANFSLAPSFVTQAAGIVDINKIHLILKRESDGSTALDTVFSVTPGADSVALTLTVTVMESPEDFQLTMDFITPTNDTAFKAGPVTVTATTDTPKNAPPVPIDVAAVYVGVGANAVGVSILTAGATVLTGDTVALNAVALDTAGVPIPGTPIAWRSLDTVAAQVPDPGSSQVVGGATRGPVMIVAELLTGPADTASVLVQPVPNSVTVVSGDQQTGQVGLALAQPITVQLTASDGLPVEGARVVFATADGGTFSADTVAADTLGAAMTTWTLGGGAGTQTATVSVFGSTAQTTVTATGTPGPAKSIVKVAGDAQAVVAGKAVSTPPSVRVVDAFGNGVAGLPVTFSVTAGGGSITGGAQNTDAAGLTTVGSWTLGTTAGTNQLTALTDVVPAPPAVTADSAGSAAKPATTVTTTATVADSAQKAALTVPASVVFTATGTLGNASLLTKVLGDVQSGTVGTVLPDSLIVVATDSNSNPVPGTAIAWSVVSGGGTLSATSTVTDSLGRAAVVLTLGTTPVSNLVRAVLAGKDSVDFTEQANVGAPAQLAFSVEPTNTTVAAVFSVDVSVEDTFGNLVSTDNTTSVSLAIAAGTGAAGAVLSGTSPVTAASGVASFTDLTIDLVGTAYQLSATATGLTAAASATFDVGPQLGVSWVNPVSGNWSVASNWSTGVVPDSLDDVFITVDGTYTVTLDINTRVKTLVLGGNTGTQTLAIVSTTMTIDTAAAVGTNGAIIQTGGTLAGPGTVSVSGSYDWSGGIQSGTGSTVVLSGATFTGSGTGTKSIDTRTLLITGSAVWSGIGQLQFRNNAVLNILAGGVFDMQTDADFGQFSAGTANVQNNGIFRKSAGAAATSFSVPFTNNSGATLDVQAGQVQFPVNGNSLGGTVTIASGAEVQVTGGTTTLPVGQVLAPSPAGLLRLTGGTMTLGGATLADTVKLGRFIMSGGTLDGGGVFLATDTVTWTNSFWSGSGKTVIPTGVILIGSTTGTKSIDARTLDISGTAEWSGIGQLQFRNNAVLNILAGGVFDMQTDADFGQFSAGTANVQNNGTFQKSGGTFVTSIDIPFTNASGGTLDVQTGSVRPLTFTQSAGSVLQGTGTFDLSGATVTAWEGTIRPGGAGATGILTIQGNLPAGTSPTIEIDVGGTTPGSGVGTHDQLVITGVANFSGILDASNTVGGFSPVNNDAFTVLTYGSMAGTFSNVFRPCANCQTDVITATSYTMISF